MCLWLRWARGRAATLGVFLTLVATHAPVAAAPYAFISLQEEDSVAVLDTSDNSVVETIEVGHKPRSVLVLPGGQYTYVSNPFSDAFSVIQNASLSVVATIPGDGAAGMAATPDGATVYAANSGADSVSVIDTSTHTITNSISVGDFPFAAAMHPNGGEAYIANLSSGTISVVNTATNTVAATINVGTPVDGIAITPDGEELFVANEFADTLSVIDVVTRVVSATIPVGDFPLGVAINPTGTQVYVANSMGDSVSVIDRTTHAVISTIAVGNEPEAIDFLPDGSLAYVTNNLSDTLSIINTQTLSVVDTIQIGQFPRSLGKFIWAGPISASPTATATAEATDTATATPQPTNTPNATEEPSATATATSIFTATPAPLCAPSPQASCRTSGKSKVVIKDKGQDEGDTLVWSWSRGSAVDLFDLGNPVSGSTDYALCVYSFSGGNPSLRMSLKAPGSSFCNSELCWQATGNAGFQYRDRQRTRDGIETIRLRIGEEGRAKATVKAKGVNLPLPIPADANNLLRQDPSVTVQLVSSVGECWGATYAAPARRVGGDRFKDSF